MVIAITAVLAALLLPALSKAKQRALRKSMDSTSATATRPAAAVLPTDSAIAAAKRGLDAYMEREKVYANLADIARMLEIASKLGRLATGLGDGERRSGNDLPTMRVEVTVALEKIYGEPLPGEVVDVEEVRDRTDATAGTNGQAQIADSQGGKP